MTSEALHPVRAELRALRRLAGPLAITNFGSMLLGVVDTAVVGRVGEVELAAVGLGNALFFVPWVLGMGWVAGLDPLVAQAIGARERTALDHLWQGAWLGAVGAVPLMGIALGLAAALPWLGIDAPTAGETAPYLVARCVGMAPSLWLWATRSYLSAHEVTRPLLVSVIVANVVNLPLTYALVFGDAGLEALGLPALGVPRLSTAGAGWASTVAAGVQLAVCVAAVRALHGPGALRIPRPRLAAIGRILRLGAPIGFQFLAEAGSFTLVTVLIGQLGPRILSAHNIALVMISWTFQAAMATGLAASVRVGHAVGRADLAATRRAGFTAIAAIAALMGSGAVVFVAFPRTLSGLFTTESGVVEATVPLLAVAAAFQLSDGVQCVAAGALRGAGDTRWPLVANLIGHYAVGVPLGVGLAFGLGGGATGLWWGLSAGLTAVAAALTIRFHRLSAREIARA
ncbi:MAG: MATE family efflux transporter [Sandaracinaceae bacterium]